MGTAIGTLIVLAHVLRREARAGYCEKSVSEEGMEGVEGGRTYRHRPR